MARTRRTKATTTPEPIQDSMPIDDGMNLSEAAEVDIVADVQTDTPKSGGARLADRLKNALLGKSNEDEDAPPAERAAISKKRSDEMAGQFMLIFSILLSWGFDAFFQRVAPAYKQVAPTTSESQAMTLPLARILARRIKASGKMSPDTLDLLMMVTAIGIYVDRARDTAKEITTALLQERALYESNHAGYGGAVASQAPSPIMPTGASVHAPTQQHRNGRTPVNQADGRQNGTPAHASPRASVDLMDELLRADAIGRRERGLI